MPRIGPHQQGAPFAAKTLNGAPRRSPPRPACRRLRPTGAWPSAGKLSRSARTATMLVVSQQVGSPAHSTRCAPRLGGTRVHAPYPGPKRCSAACHVARPAHATPAAYRTARTTLATARRGRGATIAAPRVPRRHAGHCAHVAGGAAYATCRRMRLVAPRRRIHSSVGKGCPARVFKPIRLLCAVRGKRPNEAPACAAAGGVCAGRGPCRRGPAPPHPRRAWRDRAHAALAGAHLRNQSLRPQREAMLGRGVCQVNLTSSRVGKTSSRLELLDLLLAECRVVSVPLDHVCRGCWAGGGRMREMRRCRLVVWREVFEAPTLQTAATARRRRQQLPPPPPHSSARNDGAGAGSYMV